MSKLIAKRDGYEIRQYGTWVRGWIDAEGEYHEERGEYHEERGEEQLDQTALAKAMEHLWRMSLDAAQQS